MDSRVRAGVEALPEIRPSLRGISHAASFFVSIPLGIALIIDADTGLARLGASIFAASVAVMFGASALYHCFNWSVERRRWMRRGDHAGIYGLIAGTYTPSGCSSSAGTSGSSCWRSSGVGHWRRC